MKALSENSFWRRYKKFSIWVFIISGLSIVSVMSYFTQPKKVVLEPLPTWEVNNPVSKVFVMDEIPPTAGSLAAGDSTVPNEYLDDPAIDNLLLMMETQDIHFYKTSANPSGIVGSNDVVILKPSFQWDFRNTTSTDRIKGVIWRILQHPDGFTGEILVGENTQANTIGFDDNNSEDPDQTILDVISTFYSKGYPVYLSEWSGIMYNIVTEYSDGDYNDGYPYDSTTKVSYPKFLSPSGNYYISLKYGIWDSISQTYDHNRLCLIDIPVLKAHGWTGATLAIKNWIGVLTVAYQDERYGGGDPMHFDYFFSEYALPAKVMQVTFPKLTIIDAAWANPEKNYGSIAVQLNMLLASTDPFAASWYAAKYMLTPVAYYPELTDPDYPITFYNSYNKPFLNWINCMHDSGFAVTKDSSEISVYDLSIIPVELTSFSASVNNGIVILNWRTSTETNNFGFQVERSKDKISFDQIAFIPGSGTTTETKTYSYRDTSLTGSKYYYRLKQVDHNGSYTYSQIVEVDLGLPAKYALYQNYPNPFNSETVIKFDLFETTNLKLNIYDINGKLIKSLIDNVTWDAGFYNVKWNGTNKQEQNVSSGVYFYRLEAENFTETKSMILQK